MTTEGLRRSSANDPNHVLRQEAVTGDTFIPHSMVEVEGAGLVPRPFAEGVSADLISEAIPASQEVREHEEAVHTPASAALVGAAK